MFPVFGKKARGEKRQVNRGDDGLTPAERTQRAREYMRYAAGPLTDVERRFLRESLAGGETSNGDTPRGRTGRGFDPRMA